VSKGCDISSFQGAVDFDVLRGEVSFVIAKATEGTGYTDPTFDRNWSEAKRVGLGRGAYHFARPDLRTTAQAEAEYFLTNVGPLGPNDQLALDYEVDWNGNVVGWCKQFLDHVRQMTGVTPLIYLNLSLVRGHDWSPVIDAKYPLWLALYDGDPERVPPTPWPTIAMKQWTSSGTLAGVPAPKVDLDTSLGGNDMTDEELWAALQRLYPGKVEELVKPTVRVMVKLDPETKAAVVLAVDQKLKS
jgi:lysozyme